MSYVQVPTPDLDHIAGLRFSRQGRRLMVSSWDGRLLAYDATNTTTPTLMASIATTAPVLSIDDGPGNTTFVGAADGSVRTVDYENLKLSPESITAVDADRASAGINRLVAIPGRESTMVASAFDGTIHYVDTRAQRPVHTRTGSNKVFAMDASAQNVCVAMGGRRVEIYDHRDWDRPCQVRESGLKFQVQDLRCLPSSSPSADAGYALASIDGRVAVEYLDLDPRVQANKFAFKCHRAPDPSSGHDIVHPVNCVRFLHHSPSALLTAGLDGYVCSWDWHKRKRTKQFPRLDLPAALTHADVSADDMLVAVGASDDSYARAAPTGTQTPAFRASKVWIKLLAPAHETPTARA